MVMHWNTVSMAKAKLSKLVMPPFGPTQPLLHSVPLAAHWRPFPENAHGAGSSSARISANRVRGSHHSRHEHQGTQSQGKLSALAEPGTPASQLCYAMPPPRPSRSTSKTPAPMAYALESMALSSALTLQNNGGDSIHVLLLGTSHLICQDALHRKSE